MHGRAGGWRDSHRGSGLTGVGTPTAAFVVNRTLVRDLDRLVRQCRDAVTAGGWTSLFLETTHDERGFGLARQAVAAGAALVVAVGGDGTVRACAQAVACTGVPLAVVPRGTANLVARTLGVPSAVDTALTTALHGDDRRVDLADADGTVFAAMAGIGVDAAVVGATPRLLKERLGWVAYAMSGTAHLAGRPHRFTVRLDGGEPLTRWARAVVVGNVGLLPGGFVLLPDARMDDAVLDVGILAPSNLLDWARVGHRVLTRSRRDGRQLEHHRARRIDIRADAMLQREVDGEMIPPGASLAVTVRPAALLVRAPRGH